MSGDVAILPIFLSIDTLRYSWYHNTFEVCKKTWDIVSEHYRIKRILPPCKEIVKIIQLISTLQIFEKLFHSLSG